MDINHTGGIERNHDDKLHDEPTVNLCVFVSALSRTRCHVKPTAAGLCDTDHPTPEITLTPTKQTHDAAESEDWDYYCCTPVYFSLTVDREYFYSIRSKLMCTSSPVYQQHCPQLPDGIKKVTEPFLLLYISN